MKASEYFYAVSPNGGGASALEGFVTAPVVDFFSVSATAAWLATCAAQTRERAVRADRAVAALGKTSDATDSDLFIKLEKQFWRTAIETLEEEGLL